MNAANMDAPPEIDAAPSGIGGWLLLPFLGLILSPIAVLVSTVHGVLPAFEAANWQALTTPGGPAYHALWAPFLYATLIVNAALFVAAPCLFVVGVKKRRQFPTLMIGFYGIGLLASLIDVVAVNGFMKEVMPLEAHDLKQEADLNFLRTLVFAVLWSTYFRVSRRVDNTFVR